MLELLWILFQALLSCFVNSPAWRIIYMLMAPIDTWPANLSLSRISDITMNPNASYGSRTLDVTQASLLCH